jgi:hypothetical protein
LCRKTFTVPEALLDPTLLLSPHTFLLGILFRHRAFRASDLISASQLDNLEIYPGERELRLPLREDLNEVPLFRRAVKTLTGFEMSITGRISYGMMAAWIKKIGEVLGRLYTTICYSLRYNAGNELDGSRKLHLLILRVADSDLCIAYASDAIRNLALDHGSSDPFQKHYLGRQLRIDTWAIIRGHKPQQALLKQACSIGHANSKRRPTELNAQQLASVNTDPRIKNLEMRLKGLPLRSKERQEAVRSLRKEKQRLKKALLERIKEAWTDEQAVEDIQLQIQGCTFPEPPAADPVCLPQRPAQKRLVDALTAPMGNSLGDYYRCRNNAIDAIVAYCSVAEGRTARRAKISAKKDPDPNPHPSSLNDNRLEAVVLSVFVNSGTERPRRCFMCVGTAISLEPDDPQSKELIREFYTSGDLSKHFRRRHLSQISHVSHGASLPCAICDITLMSKTHLQNHAIKVHGTVS